MMRRTYDDRCCWTLQEEYEKYELFEKSLKNLMMWSYCMRMSYELSLNDDYYCGDKWRRDWQLYCAAAAVDGDVVAVVVDAVVMRALWV